MPGSDPDASGRTYETVSATGLPLLVRNESDWYVFNEVFVKGEYDEALDVALDSARAQSNERIHILDLGANVGFFTARALERAVKSGFPISAVDCILLEGSPTVYRELQHRLANLANAQLRIRATNGLAGDRSGSAEIAEVDFYARNTLHPEHNSGLTPVGAMPRHQVSYVDIDYLTREWTTISLVKIDVEGSEQRVLETYAEGFLAKSNVVVIELHNKVCDTSRCVDILRSVGLEPRHPLDLSADTVLALFTRA